MSIVTVDNCGKGVIKDVSPSELPLGFWSDCRNFRFRNGMAEAFEGAGAATVSNSPEWLHIFEVASVRYAVAVEATAYAYNNIGFVANDITRYNDSVAITSITHVGTTATLTTATPHGRSNGDSVSVYGAAPAEYNGTFAITVTGASTYTYTIGSAPATNATAVGIYTYNVAVSFTNQYYDRITGGSLNGILVVNNPIDGLYYWAGDTSIRMRKVPLSYTAYAGRPFKNYIVQLGPTVSGTKFPHDVIWSAAADPGSIPSSFDAAPGNDAGRVQLSETNGPLVDCLPLGDVNIVYKRDAIYAMQYVGGSVVFAFTRLPGSQGLYARQCVVQTPKGHVFLAQNRDVMLHNGGEPQSIAAGRIRDWLRSTIRAVSAGVGATRTFLAVNPRKNEVWVVFEGQVSSGITYGAAVWNWNEDTWGIFSFPRQPRCGASGSFGSTLLDDVDDALYLGALLKLYWTIDSGNSFSLFGSDSFNCSLERTGIDFGDRGLVKTVQRSRWNWDGPSLATPVITTYHGGSMFADTAPTYMSGVNYVPGRDDFANGRGPAGRFSALKISSVSPGVIKLRSIDIDVTGGGKR